MKNKIITLASVLILLASCATRYQSQNWWGNGFSEVKTGPDTFIVNFKGNAYSRTDKIMQYTLRRASELALTNGFKYFKIVSTMDTSNYVGAGNSLSKAPAFSMRIQCSHEKSSDPNEVDAEYFLKNNPM